MSGVIIVDDDPDIGAGLKMLLELEGIEAHVTSSPFELSFIIKRVNPEVILVDLAMPSLSGEVVLRTLHRRRSGGDVAVLIFSGREPRELSRLADELGADGFIPKSDDTEQFIRKIKFFIEQQPRNAKSRIQRLDPYLVLVAQAERTCHAAIALRSADYQLKKLIDLKTLVHDVERIAPEGVVIDLPPLQAAQTIRELESAVPHIPLLVVTSLGRSIKARTISPVDLAADLISAVDRMLAGSVSVAM